MKFKVGQNVVHTATGNSAEVAGTERGKVSLLNKDGSTTTVPVKEVMLQTAWDDLQARKSKPKADKQKKASEDGEKVVSGNVTYDPNRYVRHEDKTATGSKVRDINDEAAEQLRSLTIDKQYSVVAKALGVKVGELKAKYEHLNPGQQRMTLGNRLRGALRAAAAVTD